LGIGIGLYLKLTLAVVFVLYNVQKVLGRGYAPDELVGLLAVLWVLLGLFLVARWGIRLAADRPIRR
jgi:hypothetical protein